MEAPAPTSEISIPDVAVEPEKMTEGTEDTTEASTQHSDSVAEEEKDSAEKNEEEEGEKTEEDAAEKTEEEAAEKAEEEAVDAEAPTEEAATEESGMGELAQLLAGAVMRAAQEASGVEASSPAAAGLGGLPEQLAATSDEGPMLRTTKAGLDELGLKYEIQEPGENARSRTIVFGMNCKVGLSRVVIATEEADKKFHFYIKAPASVPEDKRTQAALFITWVNYGLSIGNFEMDLSDGEVRFKSSNHLLGSELSTEMVGHTVALCVKMIDQFFPGLMGVVYGGKDPKDAHDECMNGGRIAHAQ
ncbi:Pfam:DUF1790 [Seminavis robusta]|uniref:Pfam:DUF1790 n=1 Tax=Seminavis robusta TaxID=568900 RepID=A0A9N8F2I2_9STRA|nr:Pfam:DUF1790 [Seminavis robusta]|eukprot:Sro3859_g351500.1 Pfam:DUF1790 (303) ;mRNA; f:1964-2872